MNYQDTLDYLYNSTPLFQNVGGQAYKEGLANTFALDNHFGQPHKQFKTIHVAGTNGKGSCSHTIAAILQSAGYRVGLYTSPHLIDFRERIRINGTPISEEYVVRFVEEERLFFEPLHPSFFELTTAMAFSYFAEEQVDIAVIEVGLGGRLDCTNIITPEISIITNISLDHTQFLGNTLADIAKEKAGIIKEKTPVVIGETTPETLTVFKQEAQRANTTIHWAETYDIGHAIDWEFELKGIYQIHNKRTILTAIHLLQERGFSIQGNHIKCGLANVTRLTGFMGRWQKLQEAPTLICDTGHNVGGIQYIVKQLKKQTYHKLRIVLGMVNDKDVKGVLSLLPTDAIYYFTKASVKRALPEEELQQIANKFGLQGNSYATVSQAVESAKKESLPEDLIFVGGSSFIVADLLSSCNTLNLN